MREIEVKYRVSDTSDVVDVLMSQGFRMSSPVVQDDQAYAPVGWEYSQSKVGVTFARLRTQNGRHLFTVKRPVDNEMSCTEHETEVADREAMHGAILAMGFRATVRIRKSRRTGRAGSLSLCVDRVEGLGCFLEVEKLVATDDNGVTVQRELDAFARSLGIDVERIHDTYDSLVRSLTHAV